MASNYPNSLDALTNPVSTDPLNNPAHAEQHEDANDAIEAVQATLGTNPEGGFATVDARLTDIASQASSASVFADAAAVSASIAQGAEVDASNAANLAEDWAIQLIDPVSGGEYSSKFHAQAAATSASAAASSATSAASSASSVDATATTATELRQFGADGSILQNLPTRVHPGEQLLKQAVWWIDAAHSTAGDQTIKNLGWGGSVLDAQSGSTAAADSNDPKFLPWEGENYCYVPGVAGNYLSVPDEAALDITGDIDLRVRVAMDDWTPATTSWLLSKWVAAGDQRSFGFEVFAAGTLGLIWSVDGATPAISAVSTASLPANDGDAYWVRVTMDVDSAGVYAVTFYYAADQENVPVSWTQLGLTVTGPSTTSFHSGTAAVAVGSRSDNAEHSTAKFYRAQILDGIDGTPVLDVDTSMIDSGSDTSFTALTGQTVTINRSTSGRKSVAVTHPCYLFGSDDYMEVADNDLLDFGASDSFTVLAVVRRWDTQESDAIVFKKTDTQTSTAGWGLLGLNADRAGGQICDGTILTPASTNSNFASGDMTLVGMVRDTAADTIVSIVDETTGSATTDATSGSLSNAIALRVGVRGDGQSYADMEFIAAAVFRKALTAGEITTLTNYFQGRVA